MNKNNSIMNTMSNLTIVIPAYNEEEAIKKSLSGILEYCEKKELEDYCCQWRLKRPDKTRGLQIFEQ